MRFEFLAQRLFNTTLAITPRKAEVIVAALSERLGIARLGARHLASDDTELGYAEPQSRDAGYDICGGVAIIPVQGTLVKKLGTLRPYSGMTGYDGIRQNFLMALADPDVKAIMLDIDSPGGEVAGCFDLVDQIYAARGQKPVWAILNECAYSAAYAIASAADRITVPRTGGTGSIGVIWMHIDWSRALDEDGMKVTLVKFGARKAEGNECEPLSETALAAAQYDIDAVGRLFAATVARNRGIDVADVIATEAATYQGERGVALGLADAVMAPDAAFRSLVEQLA